MQRRKCLVSAVVSSMALCVPRIAAIDLATVLNEELFQRTHEAVERDLLERVRRTWMDLELAARQSAHGGNALLDGHRRVAITDADPDRLCDAREQLVGNAWASAELVQELPGVREQRFPSRSRVTRLQSGCKLWDLRPDRHGIEHRRLARGNFGRPGELGRERGHARDTRGARRGEVERDVPAHAVTEDVRVRDALSIEVGDDSVGKRLDPKRAVTQRCLAVALELDDDHAAAVAEACGERRELTGVAERAVEENEIGHGKTLGMA